jgi:hypothetical protein
MSNRSFVFVLAVGVAVIAGSAERTLRAQPPASVRPLPGTDPVKVLFEMQVGLGMLRGLEQSESVARIEYWGSTGTMTVAGKTSRLTSFKVSLNYDVPGMRFDFTRDGTREIQVVAGTLAWNEETPGGTAVPMPTAAAERRLQLFLTPIGLAKSAATAGDGLKVAMEDGKTTLSLTVDGVPVRATLNKLFQPETVEARVGDIVHSRIYSDYGELNDNAKADVYLPRRIIHKAGGATVLNLTVKNSNTYNPYVIMPVPPNVRP